MRRSGVASFGVLLWCGAALAGAAEATAPAYLPPGAKLRIELDTGERRTYRFINLDERTLTVQPWSGDTPSSLPWARVLGIEVRTGQNRWRGVRDGALGGTLLGVAAGSVVAYTVSCGVANDDCVCRGAGCLGVVALATAPLTALGALVGSAAPADQWKRLPLPAVSGSVFGGSRVVLRCGAVPGGGISLSAALGF